MNAYICDRFECEARPSGKLEGSFAARYSQRMVRHEGFECLQRDATENPNDLRDLLDRNTSILASEASSGIEAQNSNLVVVKETGGGADRKT